MKKIFPLLIFAALLSSCFSTPTVIPSAEPTSTSVPTDTPSFSPTVPTPTFTDTPTLVEQNIKTSTPGITPTLLTDTPEPVMTPIVFLPKVPMQGFVKVSISDAEFYKGEACLPISVKFTAQVSDIGNTAFVLLFVRFKSKQTGATGEWADSIAMQSTSAGTYVHDLITSEMTGLGYFINAWVEYQLVATNSNSDEIGRTGIFSERLTLLECEATPTPTLTATAQKQ